MPTGVYERTDDHRRINSQGHKRYFKKNPEARRKLSESIMKSNNLKELKVGD